MSISKKLTRATTTKDMEMLRKWIPAIANHLWWCASSSPGDPVLLQEKWSSLQHHITNVHSWVGATKFVKCAHEDLPEDSSTQWLASGSAQHAALIKILSDRTILADLLHLTEFSHTGSLEVFHSNQLVWTPKRIHFSYTGNYVL
eukprot:scpid64076/ scgid22943/ 